MSAVISSPVLCLVCRKYIDSGAETEDVEDRPLHVSCASVLRARREEERLNAIARGQCRQCHQPLTEDPCFALYRGELDAFHEKCLAEFAEQERDRDRRATEHARKQAIFLATSQTKGSWGRSWNGIVREHDSLLHPPTWEWARFDNAAFTARVNKTILTLVSAWEPSMGSLLITGPTGSGKTSVLDAWLHRHLSQALHRAETDVKPTWFSFAFVSGHELVGARRNTKLGAEAPLIDLAKAQRLLILDELGSEPLSEVVFETIDHRYRASTPTVVTTGLKPKEFRVRYGDAMWRRLTESGAVIEAWK